MSSGMRTSRCSSVAQSSRSALPRRASRHTAGSMRPTGTPTARYSASRATCASSSRESSKSAARQRASPTATVSAAEDDSPAPIGTVDDTRAVDPDRRPSALGQQRGDCGRVAAPAGEPGRRRPVGRELHQRLRERSRPEPDGLRVRPPANGHAAIDGDRQDKPAGVIRVFPDQVDAAGCQDGWGFAYDACEIYRDLL